LKEASALAVNCHTSLCVHSHPKRKKRKEVISQRVENSSKKAAAVAKTAPKNPTAVCSFLEII